MSMELHLLHAYCKPSSFYRRELVSLLLVNERCDYTLIIIALCLCKINRWCDVIMHKRSTFVQRFPQPYGEGLQIPPYLSCEKARQPASTSPGLVKVTSQ